MKKSDWWRLARWAVLTSILLNVFFAYYYQELSGSKIHMQNILSRYDNLFRPAGYAFEIWEPIYFCWIIYAIYQLLPAQRFDKEYNKMALPFIIANLFNIAWTIAFSTGHIGTSVAAMAGMLFCGGLLFGRANEAYLWEGNHFWITVPFSLFLGWISMATIANVSVLLVSFNYHGGDVLGADTWAAVMIGTAFLLAFTISLAFRDFIYPLAVAWGCVAIWAINHLKSENVARIALTAGLVLIIWSLGYAIRLFSRTHADGKNSYTDA